MAEWIGRELERIRKLRGLRREDVAARLPRPVSPSTIRNIEHDEEYNVSLELLRQVAAVLGALLTPLAALLPLVEFGTGKNADCQELFAEVRTEAGR